MHHKDKLCLFAREFYEKAISEKCNSVFLGQIIQISALNNPKLSSELCMIVLQGINRYSYDEVDPYLAVFESLMKIEDGILIINTTFYFFFFF